MNHDCSKQRHTNHEQPVERCSIFRIPHAAPVHRFDMHAPERLKSNRAAVGPHAVAISWRPRPPLRLYFFVVPVLHFRGKFRRRSECLRRSSALSRWCAHRNQTGRRKIVFPAVMLRFQRASIPGRNMVRPERLSAFAQERRGAIGDSPVQQENQSPKLTRTKYPKHVQDSDGYAGGRVMASDGKIKRVSPLPELRS
jgi:hypothetical protein